MEQKRTTKLERIPQHSFGSVEACDVIDTRRLLLAIKALDGAHECAEPAASHVRSVLRAWAYFLEIATRLDDAKGADRQRIALVLESRVLSCVKRFLHGESRHHRAPVDDSTPDHIPWQAWACRQRASPAHETSACVAAVIKTALGCFLFLLARHPATATLVVRTGLHRYLLHECPILNTSHQAPSRDDEFIPCGARDVLLGIDPYDWSTRALTEMLEREGEPCDVFLLPVGPRSLIYMLQGHRIPKNEAEEVAIYLKQVSEAPSPMKPLSSPSRRKHPHHLPSIFSFPVHSSSDVDELCVVCSPQHDFPVWHIAQQQLTHQHFAVRALVAIAMLLPDASQEYKTFLLEGGCDKLQKIAYQTSPKRQRSAIVDAEIERVSPEGKDGTENFALQDFRMLRVMALAGFRSFRAKGEHSEASQQPVDAVGSQRGPTPLRDRLRAISKEKQLTVERQEREQLVQEHMVAREYLRQRVFGLLSNAIEARAQLVRSLVVMSTGREHPAGHNQSIVDWLDSFTTIEKKERERREQEELRQRRLVDLQYQIEERKRRERDEIVYMEKNDYDIPDTLERIREHDRREEFLRIQQKMRELQAREDEERRKNEEKVSLQQKREAAMVEVRRQQVMLEDRRRQQRECDLMKKEDTYYAEKIVREKWRHEHEAKLAKKADPIAEQQKRIEKMRQVDAERKRVDKEVEHMRMEDLLSRQRRFVEADMRKREAEREWKARRQMEAEERFVREQWKRLDAEHARLEQEAERRRRAEEKRQRREQERQWRQWQAAWVTAYDAYGNVYYYNQLSGESQWENPLPSW